MSSHASGDESPSSHKSLAIYVFKHAHASSTDEEPLPPRFHRETKEALGKKILKLELENEDLRDENFSLRASWKSSLFLLRHHHLLHHQKKIEYRVWALPLDFAKLGGGAPVSYHPHYPFAFTYFSAILSYHLL